MRDLSDTGSGLARPLMTARGLRFDARGARLLQIDRLQIAEGRRTVILGPNGAGKSLCLRLLHGLLRPTGGTVLFRGRPLDRAARRAQAMVFQRPVLLRRSVAANLRFALGVRGLRRDRVADYLDLAGLTALAGRPARLLSGGEQQRLALARALATEPEVLFLDEPTASLDPVSTQAVETLIAAAHARGVTIVMVTHDAGQARRIGQDAVFLSGGQVAEVGSVGDILDAPRSAPARAWAEGRLYLEGSVA